MLSMENRIHAGGQRNGGGVRLVLCTEGTGIGALTSRSFLRTFVCHPCLDC